ncbi:hypothetical protein GCM10009623_15920 [Nocardioides aestuarii]|uniref:Heme-binding protein n=1 Tax=Nocardioides aestuarii TaxID=252231 RepID=A0ABW4TJX6_9ACTN
MPENTNDQPDTTASPLEEFLDTTPTADESRAPLLGTTRKQGRQRKLQMAKSKDPELGPLELLPGTWEADGTGWNMIALPFAGGDHGFRLLLNQYDETLVFSLVDKGIPNRGVSHDHDRETDQFLVALDYEQGIHQVAVVDRPESDVHGDPGAAIHHEPGLFLNMLNRIPDGFDIARLATIPHGDSVLALGKSRKRKGLAPIPRMFGTPIGEDDTFEDDDYLEPYKFFHEHPFKGTVGAASFPGFDPTEPHQLLRLANRGLEDQVKATTILEFDSTHPTGGISNIPFVVRQANASSMKSMFWIHEMKDGSLRMQYLQVVMLDFFRREDGLPGRMQWPHVSINTLTRRPDVEPGPRALTTDADR